jgi:hypothetical protein
VGREESANRAGVDDKIREATQECKGVKGKNKNVFDMRPLLTEKVLYLAKRCP